MISPADTDPKDGMKAETSKPSIKNKRLPVITAVLLVTLGNGAGMLAAVLLWKYTGMIALPICLMLLIAASAYIITVYILNKRINKHKK